MRGQRYGRKARQTEIPRVPRLLAELTRRGVISRAASDPARKALGEPTASLDSERSGEIMEIFSELNRAGQTIVMVTHEPEFARFSERIIHLRDGMIID